MKHPSQEDLLGFVLGALDAREHDQIQSRIDNDPDIEEQLLEIKNSMLPLELIDDPRGPQIGLARRTCEFVANLESRGLYNHPVVSSAYAPSSVSPPGVASPYPNATRPETADTVNATGMVTRDPATPVDDLDRIVLANTNEQRNWPFKLRSWSHADFLAMVAAVAILGGLLFPALSYSRFQSQLVGCQSKMTSLGTAFQELSGQQIDGKFPRIPSDIKLAVSGSYAIILKDAGYILDDNDLVCPGVDRTQPFRIPLSSQIENADGTQLFNLQKMVGGDFGSALGFKVGNQIQTRCNQGRTYIILLADKPSYDREGHRSSNHGGLGQNCVFEDGHVEYIRGATYREDSIYENDSGVIGAGLHEFDNVIAPSQMRVSISDTPKPRATFGRAE